MQLKMCKFIILFLFISAIYVFKHISEIYTFIIQLQIIVGFINFASFLVL